MLDSLTRRGVLDAVADAAMIVSADLRVTAMNSAAGTLLLAPGDDPVRRELLSFFMPDDADQLIDALARSRKASQGYAGLYVRLLLRAGDPVYTELRIAALGHRQRSDSYLIVAPNTPGRPQVDRMPAGVSFGLLARHAAETLGVRHALIGRLEGSPPIRVATIAIWSGGHIIENRSYDLAGTPCAEALRRRICRFPDRVRQHFPEHRLLQELGAESYIGASILDAEYQPVGILALLDDGPCYRTPELISQVYTLSVRAAAEMERARMAADRRETEKRWLEVVRGTSDGLFNIELDTGSGFLSPRCLELLGYSSTRKAGLTQGRVPEECVHPDDRESLSAEVDRALREGTQLHRTLRLRRSGGDHRWFEVRARLTRDAVGAPVRALGFISDVTPSHTRDRILRRISEVARVVAWTYNIERDELLLLTDSQHSIGVSDEEVAALIRGPEQVLGPDAASRTRAAILLARAEGTGWDFVYSRQLASGRTAWRRTFAQVEMERGVAVHIHGGVQDITFLHELEAKCLQGQKMEAIGLLAGGIAHDFANLLTGINGLRELITAALPDDHSCQTDLAQMGEVIRSATGLSRQLLALARRQVVEPVQLSLNELLGEMRPLWIRLLGGTIRTDLALEDRLWPVLADRSQLEQVLLNLAVNARDAMPGGGRLSFRTRNAIFGAPRAALSGERPAGAFVELQVQDTGVGMDAPTLARAFEPFYTTKPPGRGTGLGLATCLGIVQQVQGQIAVESEPGKGTTVFIWFPPAR